MVRKVNYRSPSKGDSGFMTRADFLELARTIRNRGMFSPHYQTKADRTGEALLQAARQAELNRNWDEAVELYEAAAAASSKSDDHGLMRKWLSLLARI